MVADADAEEFPAVMTPAMLPRLRRGVLLAALALSACASAPPAATPPRPEVRAVAAGIVLCQTPLSSLRATLGTPSRDGLLHGRRVLSWVIEWEPLVRYLAVMVDGQERVVDLYWDIPSEVPWTPTDQCPRSAAP